jgi:hypothetical protein
VPALVCLDLKARSDGISAPKIVATYFTPYLDDRDSPR